MILENDRGFAPRRHGVFTDKDEIAAVLDTIWERHRNLGPFLYFTFRKGNDPQLYGHEGSYMTGRSTSYEGGVPHKRWHFTNDDHKYRDMVVLDVNEIVELHCIGSRGIKKQENSGIDAYHSTCFPYKD